jgi:hypothetical protein
MNERDMRLLTVLATMLFAASGNIDPKMKELFASQGVQDGGEAHSLTKGAGWTGAFSFTRRTTFE